MNYKLQTIVSICLSFQLVFSVAKAAEDSYAYAFDSVTIEDFQELMILTGKDCEYYKKDIDLLSILGKTQQLESLFSKLQEGMPPFSEQKLRKFEGEDSINYCFDIYFTIRFFNQGVLVNKLKIDYGHDYHYFTPKMLIFVNDLVEVNRYYKDLYEGYVFYQRYFPWEYQRYCNELLKESFSFNQELESIERNIEEGARAYIGTKMALIFAQKAYNITNNINDINVDSLVVSDSIEYKDLRYFSSFLKTEDEMIIHKWIQQFRCQK